MDSNLNLKGMDQPNVVAELDNCDWRGETISLLRFFFSNTSYLLLLPQDLDFFLFFISHVN
jgi:hypothetical protein